MSRKQARARARGLRPLGQSLLGLFALAALGPSAKAQGLGQVSLCVQYSTSAAGFAQTNCIPITAENPLPTTGATISVTAATQASANGTTAAFSATLAASTTGKYTWICGFSIQANATAATSVAATITGIATTLNFLESVAATPAVGTTSMNFSPCLPSSAANTAIVVNAGAAGAGGVASISAWGFVQ